MSEAIPAPAISVYRRCVRAASACLRARRVACLCGVSAILTALSALSCWARKLILTPTCAIFPYVEGLSTFVERTAFSVYYLPVQVLSQGMCCIMSLLLLQSLDRQCYFCVCCVVFCHAQRRNLLRMSSQAFAVRPPLRCGGRVLELRPQRNDGAVRGRLRVLVALGLRVHGASARHGRSQRVPVRVCLNVLVSAYLHMCPPVLSLSRSLCARCYVWS